MLTVLTYKWEADQAHAQAGGDAPAQVIPGGGIVPCPVSSSCTTAQEARPAANVCFMTAPYILSTAATPARRSQGILFIVSVIHGCTNASGAACSLDLLYHQLQQPVCGRQATRLLQELQHDGNGSEAVQKQNLVSMKGRLPVMACRAP